MSRPASRLNRLRWWLSKRIEPSPDIGEAWCIQCKLNGGRTTVLPYDSMQRHAFQHRAAGDETEFTMTGRHDITDQP